MLLKQRRVNDDVAQLVQFHLMIGACEPGVATTTGWTANNASAYLLPNMLVQAHKLGHGSDGIAIKYHAEAVGDLDVVHESKRVVTNPRTAVVVHHLAIAHVM